jgi:hypothetical protein
MAELKVTKTRFFAGVWEGVVSGLPDGEPEIEVSHLGKPVEFELTARDADWALHVPVPVALLSDGVQVFLVSDKESGDTLNSFTIITGELLEDDVRAETELLRAELDMLKRAFRRHCIETS